jgi:hypothetical protein
MFEIGKTYKIKDIEGIYYTATIIEETDDHISFTDLNGLTTGLQKNTILKWKEVKL